MWQNLVVISSKHKKTLLEIYRNLNLKRCLYYSMCDWSNEFNKRDPNRNLKTTNNGQSLIQNCNFNLKFRSFSKKELKKSTHARIFISISWEWCGFPRYVCCRITGATVTDGRKALPRFSLSNRNGENRL